MNKPSIMLIGIFLLFFLGYASAIKVVSHERFSEPILVQTGTDTFFPCLVAGFDEVVCEAIDNGKIRKINEWAQWVTDNIPPSSERGEAISMLARHKAPLRKVSYKTNETTNESYLDDETLEEIDLLNDYSKSFDLNSLKRSDVIKAGFFTNTFSIGDFYYGTEVSNSSIDETVELSNNHHSITDGLVLYLQFGDADNSTTAIDSSAYNNDGILGSFLQHEQERYNFTGESSSASTMTVTYKETDFNFSKLGNGSIAFWMNPHEALFMSQIVGVGRDNPPAMGGFDFSESSNKIYFRIHHNSTDANNNTIALNPIAITEGDRWYHIVGTFNASGMSLYQDGSRVVTTSWNGGVYPADVTEDFWVGSQKITIGQEFWGKLDEVSIWNRSLSDTEIAQLYDIGLFKNHSNVGEFESGILDANSKVYWGRINWTFTNQSQNDNVTLALRKGNYAKPDVTDSNLVAYWTLNTTSINGTAYQSYFGKYNASINGNPTNVSGVFEGENATFFRGIGNSDYLNISDTNSLNLTNNFTIMAWIKHNKDDNEDAFIIKRGRASNTGYLQQWALILNNNEQFMFQIGNTTTNDNTKTTTVLSKNIWYNVIGIRNDTALSVFLNGEFENSDSNLIENSGFIDPSKPTTSLIGFAGSGNSEFNGSIAHVAIFNRTLSEDEIMNWTVYTAERMQSEGFDINDTDIEKYRFLQYKAYLRTNDTKVTPVLSRVDASYPNGATTFKLNETGVSLEDSDSDIIFTPQIWISSMTTSLTQIASNMTGDVSVQITYNVSTCDTEATASSGQQYIESTSYVSHDGTNISFNEISCSSLLKTIEATIQPASNSNNITTTYGTKASSSGNSGSTGLDNTAETKQLIPEKLTINADKIWLLDNITEVAVNVRTGDNINLLLNTIEIKFIPEGNFTLNKKAYGETDNIFEYIPKAEGKYEIFASIKNFSTVNDTFSFEVKSELNLLDKAKNLIPKDQMKVGLIVGAVILGIFFLVAIISATVLSKDKS